MNEKEQLINQFAEEASITKEESKKIIDILYKKGLDVMALDMVLWRLRRIVKEEAVRNLMKKMKKETIEQVIDQIIAEKNQQTSPDCESSYTDEMSARIFSVLDIDHEKLSALKAGDTIDIQIMRTGTWTHPIYKMVNITKDVLKGVVKNFKDRTRKVDLVADENHEPNHKALGIFRDVYQKGKEALFAKIELTQLGVETLAKGAYHYFSPEIIFNKIDEETQKPIQNLLIGGAFTNRPFFKSMAPMMANEASVHQKNNGTLKQSSQTILFFNENNMKELLELIAKFGEIKSITLQDKENLESKFNSLDEDDKTPELKEVVENCFSAFDEAQAEPEAPEGEEPKEEEKEAKKEEPNKEEEELKEEPKKEEEEPKEEAPKTEEPVQASEDMVSIKASELESLKAQATENSKMYREVRKQKIETIVEQMKFSESNDKGLILPKDATRLVEFALTLSEKQEKAFFELTKAFQSTTHLFNEIGHGNSLTKEQLKEAGAVDMNEVNYLVSKGFSEDEALATAKESLEMKKEGKITG